MNPFEYRKPTTEQVEMIEAVRKACKDLHDLLQEIPMGFHNGNYKDMATKKLEEVSMWANKAVVFYDKDEEKAWDEAMANYTGCEDESCDICGCESVESFSMPSGAVEGVMVVESEEDGG